MKTRAAISETTGKEEPIHGRPRTRSSTDLPHRLNSLTFLGSIRFLPIDDLTIDVSGSWDRTSSRRRGRRCAYQQDSILIPADDKEQLREDCFASEPYSIATDAPNNDYQQSYGVWGTIAYDIGEIGPIDSLVVKSITSWREQTNDKYTTDDIDTTTVSVTRLDTLPGRPGCQQIPTAWDDRINLVGGFFSFGTRAATSAATVAASCRASTVRSSRSHRRRSTTSPGRSSCRRPQRSRTG